MGLDGLYTREHCYSSLPFVFPLGIPIYTTEGRDNDLSPSSKPAGELVLGLVLLVLHDAIGAREDEIWSGGPVAKREN